MIQPAESIAWIRRFPLKEEVKDKWLGQNAARLRQLDDNSPQRAQRPQR